LVLALSGPCLSGTASLDGPYTGLAAPGSTAVFCFRFAAVKGFGSPAILRTGAALRLRLGGPPEKADLDFGSGPARFWVPRETSGAEKENLKMFVNRATLIGFLGKDAEVRYTRNETPFTVLSLATKRSWKNRETGEYESETTWHRCIVGGTRGEFAATLTKGAHVQIEGEIRMRQYTQDDAKRTVAEVRVLNISKLDRPAKTEAADEKGAAA
jgi:single-strand DNA-binding protein